MTTISATVLTRNAELRLPACLQSLQGVADEVVVLDDGSTDCTRDIAAEFHARVFSRTLDDFSSQRNAAIAHCTGDWVLVIDADEWLSDELRDEICALKRGEMRIGAVRVPRKNLLFGAWVRGCGWYPDYSIRMFPRAGAHYSGLVHEGPAFSGEVVTLSGALGHYSYENMEQYLEKLNRYTTLSARDKYRAGKRAGIADLILRPPLTFLKQYILRKGFRDGISGFLLSALSSYYVFCEYAKLYYRAGDE